MLVAILLLIIFTLFLVVDVEAQLRSGRAGKSKNKECSITVTGRGVVSRPPDEAQVRMGIFSRAETSQAALDAVSAATRNITDMLKQNNIYGADIQTDHFSVSPEFQYTDGERKFIGYVADTQLRIIIKEIAGVGTLLDKIVEIGGESIRISSVAYALSAETRNAAQKDARTAAIDAAKADATQIAASINQVLDVPLRIQQISSSAVIGRPMFQARAMAAGGRETGPAPIEAGEAEVVVDIEAVFATRA